MFLNHIEIWGILINEPGSFISDLIMGIACLFFYFRLLSKSVNKQHKQLSYFFLFFALTSIIGAFAHGFNYIFGMSLHILSWSCSGFAVYFLLAGSSGLITNQWLKNAYNIFNIFQLSLLILLILIHPSFAIAKISMAFSLAGIILPLYIVDTIKNSYLTNLYIFFAIAIACIPAIFHTIEFEFGYIFNMNDLSHFTLILVFYFVYLGLEKRFFTNTLPETMGEEKIRA
ncbi:MAG: hypothetical protein LBQ22_02225 [Bacteroidales bacterium]|jgi:hypothetical protein|nr:hypothetical protein [Bacteroidales bacterium]